MKKISAFFIFSFAFFPVTLQACTVCFGGTDSALQRGFTWGVVVLGVLPFLMLTALVVLIVRTARRNRPAS